MLTPLYVSEDPQVQYQYEQLCDGLNMHHVPLFFAYFGNFPAYLEYITLQLKDNLQDETFAHLIRTKEAMITELMNDAFDIPEAISEWVQKYRYTPSMYEFKYNVQSIARTSVVIALVFVALREAVKGWAVAAKRVESTSKYGSKYDDDPHENKESPNDVSDDVFSRMLIQMSKEYKSGTPRQPKKEAPNQNSNEMVHVGNNRGIAHQQERGIERDLLQDYLRLTREEFEFQKRSNLFWTLRVKIEEFLQLWIHELPHPIQSPINVTSSLIKQYPHANEFMSILIDNFPTLGVQRMMYSMYMKLGFEKR